MTNTIYRSRDGIGVDTAGRDLRAMVERGLLIAVGERRGRHYVGSGSLRAAWQSIRSQRRIDDRLDPFAD
ncbi:MAG: hypothetical protein ACRDNK_14825 [Solirubrobacteraceae bacterium]